jgi:hypothetical protein
LKNLHKNVLEQVQVTNTQFPASRLAAFWFNNCTAIYPECRNQPEISWVETRWKAAEIAGRRLYCERAFTLRRYTLILLRISSMGLRSGLSGGR